MSERSARPLKGDDKKRVIFGHNCLSWIEEKEGVGGDKARSPWVRVSSFMAHEEGRKLADPQ